MAKSRFLAALLLLTLAISILSTCMNYFNSASYRAAAIRFQKALQVDPRLVEAYYQPGNCALELGVVQDLFTQLLRSGALKLASWKAQIDIGNMLLSGELKEPLEKAQLVLSVEANDRDAVDPVANGDADSGKEGDGLNGIQRAKRLNKA